MSRELDRRDFTAEPMSNERRAALERVAEEVSESLPGEHSLRVTRFDDTIGVPRVIASEAAPAEDENFIERALTHVAQISPVIGFTRVEPEYVPDEEVQRASSGAAAVHLQQEHAGIPIFQATETVRFNPDGSLRDTAGSSVPIDFGGPAEPSFDAEAAVRRAAEHVAQPDADESAGVDEFGTPHEAPQVDLAGFSPEQMSSDDGSPRRAATFRGSPFEDEIQAGLMWFALGEDLRLTWEVLLTFPDYAARWRTLVDAMDGAVLYCRQLVRSVAATGNVYRVDGSTPRQTTDFPVDPATYGINASDPLPDPWPDQWVTATETAGNSAVAHLGVAGPTLGGAMTNGVLTFDPADPSGDDQKVLNIFYFNCVMHDYCYLLGFRETSGNFQQDNLGRGGVAEDPVDARAHAGAVQGTANMATLEDGRRPVMNMGLVTGTNRHTAFDSSVVFHEFMHGVTNRMVGGPADTRSLEAPQSVGMGEGWSDWIACTINGTDVVGAWVVDQPQGIRRHPYDDAYPNGFGDLEQPEFQQDEHAVGEVWCAMLSTLNRRIGVAATRDLVFDALLIAAANPSFIDMRDDLLTAAELLDQAGRLDGPLAELRGKMWEVFAQFGMGPAASSQGAQLMGIVADHSVPGD